MDNNGKSFIIFLFSFLSLLSSLYSFFFSPLSYSSSDIPINPYLLLSLFFLLTVVAFLSLSTLPRHLLNLMLIFVVVGFFFFFCNDLMGGFDSGWVEMVMGRSVVVGCDG